MSQYSPVNSWEVLKLTLPQMGLMLCHLAVSMTDLWVCGQIDGRILAVLGGISQIFAFLMLVASMVASGCMATVSRAVGAGHFLRARRYSGLVLCISLLAGSCVAVLALLALPLLPLLGLTSPALAPAVGLFVVIPAVCGYNFFRAKLSAIEGVCINYAGQLLNRLRHEVSAHKTGIRFAGEQ